jgi:2-keto-4-pentenoate hydratase/2-oxohepta-3-ene-1,7-dioic acid hydratase in catechol pathway
LSPSATLSTLGRPGKVLAVGRNYAEHAKEMGSAPTEAPFFFLKAPSTAIGNGDPIVIPWDVTGDVHHEAELAVIIGLKGRRIPEERAMEHVLGYCCANDVTARTEQKKYIEKRLPWYGGKNADTFLALGPGLTLRDSLRDPMDLHLQCIVDGGIRQDDRTSSMVHGIASLIACASRRVTLEAGDVILTGTPAGVGPLVPGQTVEVRIEGLGSLINPVHAEVRPE